MIQYDIIQLKFISHHYFSGSSFYSTKLIFVNPARYSPRSLSLKNSDEDEFSVHRLMDLEFQFNSSTITSNLTTFC